MNKKAETLVLISETDKRREGRNPKQRAGGGATSPTPTKKQAAEIAAPEGPDKNADETPTESRAPHTE